MARLARHDTPQFWWFNSFRGHDKLRLIWVAIAIDPFQVVYLEVQDT